MIKNPKLNASGCPDPTAYKALKGIARESADREKVVQDYIDVYKRQHPVRARNSEARICATAVRYASIGRRDSIAKQIHSDLRTNRLE